jgi:ABC-type nitrate/sulfonate/bicarbonate transport system substrate-binding protein
VPRTGRPWDQFRIRAYRHQAAADARRVVFAVADPAAAVAVGAPAVVVLSAGGEPLVRYDPPRVAVRGLGREDYLQKAAEVVKGLRD